MLQFMGRDACVGPIQYALETGVAGWAADGVSGLVAAVSGPLGDCASDGAAFGLTPRRQQSGEIDRMGGISKCGDAIMREMLFEAALVLMTPSRKWSWLKAWGMKIARHRSMKRAIVAVARRLAIIMHRNTEFRWTREEAPAT